ncbi:hypothetical protein NPIL_291991 [Nephila pilipes]|uniref:Secreted protein n=1 Tax=Nephila pilipes TaxID=299642 RepID=A0A8X6N8S2_NEPPI|nr:hypothetical protein NPIL_291991 [Nephila pilipes]
MHQLIRILFLLNPIRGISGRPVWEIASSDSSGTIRDSRANSPQGQKGSLEPHESDPESSIPARYWVRINRKVPWIRFRSVLFGAQPGWMHSLGSRRCLR